MEACVRSRSTTKSFHCERKLTAVYVDYTTAPHTVYRTPCPLLILIPPSRYPPPISLPEHLSMANQHLPASSKSFSNLRSIEEWNSRSREMGRGRSTREKPRAGGERGRQLTNSRHELTGWQQREDAGVHDAKTSDPTQDAAM